MPANADQGIVAVNPFQRMMLAWEKVHPYNAVHALELPGLADPEALSTAIHETCTRAGIGKVQLDARTLCLRYRPDFDATVECLAESGSDHDRLARWIERQLNLAFPAEPHHPFRWAAVDNPSSDTHFLAAAYRHVCADARAVQQVLGAIVRTMHGDPSHDHTPGPHGAKSKTIYRLKRPRRLESVVHAFRRHSQLRRAHRMPEPHDAPPNETGFRLLAMPPDLLPALRNRARAEQAGLNDLFLAAMTVALARLTPNRPAHPRRTGLGLATALNTRHWARLNLDRVFTVCLGNAAVIVRQPDAGFRSVLQQIVPQTRKLKAGRYAGEPAFRANVVRRLWPIIRLPQQKQSYTKTYPIAAAVSSVTLDPTLFGSAYQQVGRYIRAAPPGLAMPIVLAPTIGRDTLDLGLVYRTACLTADAARDLLQHVADILADYGSGPT